MVKEVSGAAFFVLLGFALGFFRSRSAQDASTAEAVQIGIGCAGVFLVLLLVGLWVDRERRSR